MLAGVLATPASTAGFFSIKSKARASDLMLRQQKIKQTLQFVYFVSSFRNRYAYREHVQEH